MGNKVVSMKSEKSEMTRRTKTPKLIFFDVDGTLLPGNAGSIPGDTVEAIRELQKRGHKVVTCTGRHPNEVKAFDHVGFDGYVLLNGQLCRDSSLRPIFSNPIVGTDKDELLRVFHGDQVPLILVELGRQFMNFHTEHVKEVQDECAIPVYPIEEYTGADILMATAFVDWDLKIGGLKVARWHQWALDVYPDGAGKKQGIEVMMKHFGVDRENTIAFGDAHNDIEMLQFAGIGVAMGNGYEETKKAADYVTGDCDKGGIVDGLRHFGLI